MPDPKGFKGGGQPLSTALSRGGYYYFAACSLCWWSQRAPELEKEAQMEMTARGWEHYRSTGHKVILYLGEPQAEFGGRKADV